MVGLQYVKILGNELLVRCFFEVKLWDGLLLEGLVNCDLMFYVKKYGFGLVEGLIDFF